MEILATYNYLFAKQNRCEDSLNSEDYFSEAYEEALELTAYLCKKFNIDPHGTVKYNGVTVPTILCHADSCNLGLGSNHGDIYHWFPKFGKCKNKTMQDVRNDIVKVMNGEYVDMTQEKFNEFMNNWLLSQEKLAPADWSKEDRKWAEDKGIIKGDAKGNKMYKRFITREEVVALLHRLNKG